MSVWKAKMETAFFSERESYMDECMVKLEGENISVSYDGGEHGNVVYRGSDQGNGHFVLKCPELNAEATLHCIKGSKRLEGYWFELGGRGFWIILLEENQEELNLKDNNKEDIKKTDYLGSDFLNFVIPNEKPICSIEIDVDNLAKEYQFGAWEDLIFSIAAKWIEENSFTGSGTVWAWGGHSTNFHHPNFSMFYAILGMPKEFREYIGQKISVLGEHVRAYSDYVIPNQEDGWDSRCHIEYGKVWQILDPVTCREIKA